MNREEIIANNQLRDLVEARGFTLQEKRGKLLTNCCPQAGNHRRKNHMPVEIDENENVWYCNDCKVGGSVIDWIMTEKNMTATEAMKDLGGGVTAEDVRVRNPDDNESAKAPSTHNDGTPPSSKEIAAYNYTNENGQLLYQVVRYEPKTFKQRRPDGDEWKYNLDGVTRVLYNLPKVLLAKQVMVVEGERDADTLSELGFVATTNAGGSGNWLAGYSETLKGKDVIVFRDMDYAGKKHQDQVVQSMQDKALSIKAIELPPFFKDVSEWMSSLEDDKRKTELLRLLDNTPHTLAPLPIYSLTERQDLYQEFLKKQAEKSFSMTKLSPDFADIVDPLFPGEVAMFVGDTNAGKTVVMQKIAQVSAPQPTLLFELELPVEKMFEREVQMSLGCYSQDVKKDYSEGTNISNEKVETLGKHVWICPESGIDMDQIEKYINKSELKIGQHPAIVLIDYMTLVKSDYRNGRYEAIARAAEQSKVVAKRTNTIVFEGSQIARPPNDKRQAQEIFLHSAKGAGELEASANLVIGLSRYIRDGIDILKMKILKATSGEVGGEVEFQFHGKTLQLTPLA